MGRERSRESRSNDLKTGLDQMIQLVRPPIDGVFGSVHSPKPLDNRIE